MTEEELIHRIANYPQAGDGLSGEYEGTTYHVDCAGNSLVAVHTLNIERDHGPYGIDTWTTGKRLYTRTEWRDLVYSLNKHITKPEKPCSK